MLTAGQQNPGTRIVALPPKQFSHALGSYNLAMVELPNRERVVSGYRPERPSEVESELEDADAGMGKVRLSLLKLGCRADVDAPLAVGVGLLLIPGVRCWRGPRSHPAQSRRTD